MKAHRFATPATLATPAYGCLLVSLCWLFLAAPLQAAQYEEEISTQDYLFIKGIIQSVSVEDQTIKVKQKKGPTITFSVDRDTIIEGFHKLSELKPRQHLKVWYRPEKEINKALKLLKPLDLGC